MAAESNGKANYSNSLFWTLILLGCFFQGVFYYVLRERFWIGLNDFMGFYSSGKLAFTGLLYDPSEHFRVQRAATNGQFGESWMFVRFPFYAILLWPFGQLPYSAAWRAFLGVCTAAIAAGTALLPLPNRKFGYALLIFCLPAGAGLLNGQDVAIVYFFFALGGFLLSRGYAFSAGSVWAFLAIKPHLFVFLPLVLLYRRDWRVLGGGALGGAVLLILSFVVGGPEWPAQLRTVLTRPALHSWDQMPNLHLFFGPHVAREWISIPAGVCLAALLWPIQKKWPGWVGLLAAVPAGILVTSHVYISDCLLLLPFSAWLLHEAAVPWQRGVAFASLTPIVYFCLILTPPAAYIAPAVLSAALLSLLFSARPSSRLPEPTYR
jgi:hypothetical protein